MTKKCAENLPGIINPVHGIDKTSILIFFAFTDLIHLQILQTGFRVIIHNPMLKVFKTLHISSIIFLLELNFIKIMLF